MTRQHIAIIVILIALSQIAMAVFYMRPRFLINGGNNSYKRWKLLLYASIGALVTGGLMLLISN